MTPQQKEDQRLINQALDQLDADMTAIYAQCSSLVTTWMTHEMTAGEKSFQEAAVHLARNFMLPNSLSYLKEVGKQIDRDVDEHTVGEDV